MKIYDIAFWWVFLSMYIIKSKTVLDYDSTLWIPDWIPGTGLRIPCRVKFACIPWAELQIPMPRIADPTSKNFPDFEIQIALYGAKHGGNSQCPFSPHSLF